MSACATAWGRRSCATSPSTIEPHSFQFLTGPSGAGKTSLLRLLFLSLRPTRGLITLFDHDVASLPQDAWRGAAAAHRHRLPGFPPARSPDDLRKCRPAAARGRAGDEASYRDEVIELLQLGGARRAHACAAAGAFGRREAARGDRAGRDRRPELLLADEPTGNVDPALARAAACASSSSSRNRAPRC